MMSLADFCLGICCCLISLPLLFRLLCCGLVHLVLWAFLPMTYLSGILHRWYSLQAPSLAPQLRHYEVK